MTDKRFTLDSDHMESLIYAIRDNAERESQGYLRFVFAEKIERVSEDMPSETKDKFFSIATQYGYLPSIRQIKTMEAANDG